MSRVQAKDYLPGCYRNLRRGQDESLGCFLLRLAEANGYIGIRGLLAAAGLADRRDVERALLDVRLSRNARELLGRMAIGDRKHLDDLALDPIRAIGQELDGVLWNDTRVSLDSLALQRAAFCPACLESDGQTRIEWDLAPVVACTTHRIALCDTCPVCGEPTTWRRSSVSTCGTCGASLAKAARQGVGAHVVDTTLDFASLAPFATVDPDFGRRRIEADEMSTVFRTLLLSEHDWAALRWPARIASVAPVATRVRAVEQLAALRTDTGYELWRLAPAVFDHLAPLDALPGPWKVAYVARSFLITEAGLSFETACSLTDWRAPECAPTAVELFGPALPRLESPEDARTFAGASPRAADALRRLGLLPDRSGEELAYDLDELLRARRFLDGLVTLAGLSSLTGVRLDARALSADGLFPRWNGPDPTDDRVRPERLLELQLRLLQQWRRATPPESGVTLGDLTADSFCPFTTMMSLIEGVLAGTITAFSWEAPFRWSDLVIDPRQIGRRRRGTSLRSEPARTRHNEAAPALRESVRSPPLIR